MSGRDELLPQIIRHLRESKRMTVDTVAKYLEVSTDDIRQYESGAKKLRPALFIALSALFKVPLNIFELKEPDGHSIFRYRRTVNKELEEYTYTLYGYMNNILKIYSSNKIDIFNLPASDELYDFNKSKIIEYTKILRNSLKLSDSEPISNLPKILDNLGIEVIYTELPDGINGVSYTLQNSNTHTNSIVFFIANNDNLFKQSFSIAHEFGHVLMHRNSENINDNIEEMANYFANVFLLPPDSVKTILDEILKSGINEQMNTNSKLYILCSEYGVSVKTVLWSMYHSGKMDKEQLNELCLYYDNIPQEQKFPKIQGMDDNIAYNKKMYEAVQKGIITKNEYNFVTGFNDYNNIILERA